MTDGISYQTIFNSFHLDKLPEVYRPLAFGYLQHGGTPDNFLLAVLANDLIGCLKHADSNAYTQLHVFAEWVSLLPEEVRGSKKKVEAWFAKGGLMGEKKATESTIKNELPDNLYAVAAGRDPDAPFPFDTHFLYSGQEFKKARQTNGDDLAPTFNRREWFAQRVIERLIARGYKDFREMPTLAVEITDLLIKELNKPKEGGE